MFNCLRKTVSTHLKFKCFSSYNQKFYSISFCNKNQYNLKKQKDEQNKFESLQQQQFRFISQYNLENQNLAFYDKIASSELSSSIRNVLMEIHDDLNIPWWGCIALTTLVIKFSFTLVVGIYQQHLGAKVKLAKIEFAKLAKGFREKTWEMALKEKWSAKQQKKFFNTEMSKAWNDLVVKNNCHPFKMYILSYLQIPVWVLLSVNLRKLTVDAPPEVLNQLANEGPFWSTNLLLPDSSFICPLIIAVSGLSIVEMNNNLRNTGNKSRVHKISVNVSRGVAIIGFLISIIVPATVSFYWAFSTFYSFCQYILFLSPRLRRFCRIPITPLDSDTPYRNIYVNFKEKIKKIINKT